MKIKEIKAKKYVIFAFNENPVCFMHPLLNALDMDSKETEANIIISRVKL